jgi:glycosyltransferase involved in cell wall biosynthesis
VKRGKVLVYGSFAGPGTPCGVTAAMEAFISSPISKVFDFEVITTRRGPDPTRGLARRLAHGVRLVTEAAVRMPISGADLVDVHAVSGRDFLKNSAVVLAARLSGRPAVLRIHGGDFIAAFERAGRVEQGLVRRLLRAANRVVVLSQRWADVITGIEPRATVAVIPNSIDCDRFAELARQRAPGAAEILLLANLCARKGHFEALEVAARLTPTFPSCQLLFAGAERDVGALEALRSRAGELGIQDNAHFLGPVFGADKDALFARAGIFILPSHVENMPVSLMEAMAAGLPVVASTVGAVPEMVEDGKTGFLIEPHDTEGLATRLAQLLRDPELRLRMGSAAQGRARSLWDTKVVAAACERLYEDLL